VSERSSVEDYPDDHVWPRSRREAAQQLRKQGLTHEEIGVKLGATRAAVGSLFARIKRGHYERHAARNPAPPAFRFDRDIKPSRTPFAADCSCPDFAWDEDHLAAIRAVRPTGFPVAFAKRRSR